MAMGIVSDEEFESELKDSSTTKQTNVEVINLPEKGRKEGDNNVPDSLRKIIGETTITDGRAEGVELGRQFGISPSSVSAYSNGSTSTKSYSKQPNLEHLNKVRERITRRARKVLVKSIDNITDDKLADAKPEVLANVARGMSAIIKELEPELPKEPPDKNGPTFVFFSPTFRKEEHFEHIFVQDNK